MTPTVLQKRTAAAKMPDDNLQLLHVYHESCDDKVRKDALAALVEQNAGLVRAVTYRYKDRIQHTSGVEYEDLLQIGTMGMLKAIRSFDFSYATTFSTYAVPLIIGEIRRFLRDDGMVKVSRDIRRRGYLVLQAKESFLRREGREPTVSELAEVTGEPVEELVFLLDAAAPVHSLSEPMTGDPGDEDAFTLEHVLCDDDNAIDRLTDRLSLRQAIAVLPEEEQRLLLLRYQKQLSQQQTAEILGVSQVKVSRMEKKIFDKLRTLLGGRR